MSDTDDWVRFHAPKVVRDWIRAESEERGVQYSDVVDDWIPENPPKLALEDDQFVRLRLRRDTGDRLDESCGPRIRNGEALTYYWLLNASPENVQYADHLAAFTANTNLAALFNGENNDD